MFYSEYVLAKKGPLGQFWLAAHWTKKLTRAQISKSDVKEACAQIMKPAAPLALRTSGHLLLGVVRIHDSKQNALMNDCSDAFVKIKLAFRPGNVDLTESQAAVTSITVAEGELFVDFDDLADLDLDMGEHDGHATQTTRDAITLAEDNFPLNFEAADDFLGGSMEWQQPKLRDQSDIANNTTISSGIGGAGDITGTTDGLGITFDELPSKDFEDFQPNYEDYNYMPQQEEAAPMLQEDEELKLEELQEQAAPASTRKVKVSKKRHLIIDQDTEIPGKVMRDQLKKDGPNDITRVAYQDGERGPLDFDPIPSTRRAMKRLRLQEQESSRSTTGLRPLLDHGSSAVKDLLALPLSPLSDDEEEEEEEDKDKDKEMDVVNPEEFVPEEMNYEENNYQFEDNNKTLDTTFGDAGGLNDTSFLFQEEEEHLTKEQYEDAGWTVRTQKMISNLASAFEQQEELKFSEMTSDPGANARSVKAACFFELLVLKTKDIIEIEQDEPFGDITVTATDNFEGAAIEAQ